MDVSDIFYFFRSGEGKDESEAPGRGGGGRFLIENPKKGGGLLGGGGGGGGTRGLEGVCGELGGRGLNIFFRARNAHQVQNRAIRILGFQGLFKH